MGETRSHGSPVSQCPSGPCPLPRCPGPPTVSTGQPPSELSRACFPIQCALGNGQLCLLPSCPLGSKS